jgi:hypothetical protein
MTGLNAQTRFLDALKSFRPEGFNSWALFIQAMLETGNFTTKNATERNNFFNQYSYPGDGWTGQTYGTGDLDEHGKPISVLSKIYLTPLDGLYDLKEYEQKKFPLMWADRADEEKYFNGIMTLGDWYQDGALKKRKILYPSFCDDWKYSENLISLSKTIKTNQPDLFTIITT